MRELATPAMHVAPDPPAAAGIAARIRDSDVAPCSVTRTTSADIEDQAASLKQWKQVYDQLTPGPFVGSLHEICCGGIQVFRETTNQAVHESGAPWRGSRAIGVPVRMAGAALFRGQAVDPDTMVTLGGDDELDFYTPRGFDILGLVVDESTLESHARQVEHRDIAVDFGSRGAIKLGSEQMSELRRRLLSVLQSLDANPTALQYRQAQRVLEHSMLSAVMAAITDDLELPKPLCPSREHIVDAAKAFMYSRIADPITVADLCIELGVSRRTLQYSFQDVLGINPVRFLRALRLNGVRRDLKDAALPTGTVQDTAAKWGFWHLGHFVTDYKRMFGELPSETLRRKGQPRRRFDDRLQAV